MKHWQEVLEFAAQVQSAAPTGRYGLTLPLNHPAALTHPAALLHPAALTHYTALTQITDMGLPGMPEQSAEPER